MAITCLYIAINLKQITVAFIFVCRFDVQFLFFFIAHEGGQGEYLH